jgi:hypothetical protein
MYKNCTTPLTEGKFYVLKKNRHTALALGKKGASEDRAAKVPDCEIDEKSENLWRSRM